MPILFVFLLLIPLGLPKHSSSFTEVFPPFALLAIYFWSMGTPVRIGPAVVLLAGLVQDVLISTPFGSSALLWVVFHYLVVMSRKELESEGFMLAWVYFAILLFAVVGIQWSLVVFYRGSAPSFYPIMMQWLLGVLFYPSFHAWFYTMERSYFRKYWYYLKPE